MADTPGPPGTGSGLIMGRFAPFHAGHRLLLDFARVYCREVTVAVSGDARLPGLSGARIVHIPQAPDYRTDPGAWATAWRQIDANAPDYVFGSFPGGRELARALGARRFVPLDVERESGVVERGIGNAEWGMTANHPKRIAIVGAESTGKSTLARTLAHELGGLYVPEYAREHVAYQDNEVDFSDAEYIARGHVSSEEALACQSAGPLCVDTDLQMTCLYCEFLYGRIPWWVKCEAAVRWFDLTIVLDCDVPWGPDPQRSLPTEADRLKFRDRLITEYDRVGRPWRLIGGDWESRRRGALAALAEVGILPRP